MTAGRAPQRFLLVHGWQHHRPPGHWLGWLAGQLAARGLAVSYPQLPQPDAPEVDVWLRELDRELDESPGAVQVVVCHSLGCLLWLRRAARGRALREVERVVLVAPPDGSLPARVPELTPFFGPVDPHQLAATSREPVRLVCSDDDPYCPSGAAGTYGESLGLDVDLIPARQHLDLEAGFGPWPDMLAWCLDPAVRVTDGVAHP